ncbi:hypothetical protein HJB80_02905 [Rhizobium lentis]|uniref:hypothetical protein n=1 Tax=Rhizobium lentis TaxID=1138194 RepID=UPI001C8295B9|nr:hypothetical protein [Rhizobium lentis]MBX5131642.1 hypothetical protein [Rhizobium lentis]
MSIETLQKIISEIKTLKSGPVGSDEYHGGYQDGRNDALSLVEDALENKLDGPAEVSDSLLASAPDLLKALKYARRFLRGIDHDVDYVDSIIAKAEGK